MKAFRILALVLACVGALHRSIETRVRNLRGPEDVAAGVSTDEILAEIKHRVEVCGDSESPLAAVGLDCLFNELKKRAAAKECEGKADGSPSAQAAKAGGAAAKAAGGEKGAEAAAEKGAEAAAASKAAGTTTTSTQPCPDNFMDEIVDQANVDFSLYDANRDGCLSGSELTAPLKKQIDMARHRDYYWIRRNITNAARGLVKDWDATHANADESGNSCLNREELDVIHHAICDCPTQFMFMDHNADGKISQQEAATYVSDQMPQANLNYVTLKKIFQAADSDGSKYISEQEFCEAGAKYHGDGKDYGHGEGVMPAPAPGPAPGPAPR